MDIARFMMDLSKGIEEAQKPMTLEEAIYYIDPDNDFNPEKMAKMPDSIAAGNALTIKARSIVVEYARRKLKEEISVDSDKQEE